MNFKKKMMNFRVFSTFQVDYSVSWSPNGKYIQLDQSCLVVWGKSMSQKLSFLLEKNMQKCIPLVNVKLCNIIKAGRVLRYIFRHIISSWVCGHEIIPQSMNPIWCFYLKSSCFHDTQSGFIKKGVFGFLSHIWRVLLLSEVSQLHPHLSNPNEWHLHLCKLLSTSVHPAWGIILLTSRRLHSNYAFFMCLLCLSTPKQ